MSSYQIYFEATAGFTMEVEAASEDEAREIAYKKMNPPFFPGGMHGDLGDWEIPEDGVELLGGEGQ